jgi:lipopolysaccharide transport system ATP-binding protein
MELTGRDNVYLSGAILGMKRREIDRKFDEIVAFSEVEAFIDTPVKHYSHGMYVRIAFAVAAHLQAEILLVDEVLAAGDAAFQQKCIDKMRALANDGRTILIASHQLQTLHQLCPRSVRLEHGALKQIAETSVATAAHLASQSSRQMGD